MRFRFLLFTSVLFFFACGLKAQNPLKIGHVNVQELVEDHPSMDSIKAVIEKEQKEMEELYSEMLTEHENKMKTFEAESSGYSDFVRKAKQKEIMQLAQKIQDYNQSAQQQLQQRNIELIQPVYAEINQEITNVAGAANFSYVLDISNGSVAYISPDSEDITPLVLERLKK